MMSPSNLRRPNYHFTPPRMWMNDPNGLVWYKGNYHLFYQYHPYSPDWGPMHWGHAVSRDLINWQHLPITLRPDENGMIFSGSVVIDRHNTAGFGREAMVAIFSHHRDGHQSQSLAYSHDEGLTWHKYSDNPILVSPGPPDFRDPRVFWYEDGWVMSLAAGNFILFYLSKDLIHWLPSGNFGNGYGCTDGVWETPDLFKLKVRGGTEARWILTVSVGNGHPAGGSGTQYFIGHFDGKTFISENAKETILWADFGADYYAPQSWNEEPKGRRLMIGWMSNWRYASAIPSQDWRGTLSLIREVSLKSTEEGLRLVQQPIGEMKSLRKKKRHWQNEYLTPGKNLFVNIDGSSFELLAEFQITNNIEQLGIHVYAGNGERTTIGYLAKDKRLFVDRSGSGKTDFHPDFAGIHDANLSGIDHLLRLQIFVDRYSIEVFTNEGPIVITDCIFPSWESTKIELSVEGDQVVLNSLDLFELSPAQYTLKEAL